MRRIEEKVKSIESKLKINECNSNPCQNGGTCQDLYEGYQCHCPLNWEVNYKILIQLTILSVSYPRVFIYGDITGSKLRDRRKRVCSTVRNGSWMPKWSYLS